MSGIGIGHSVPRKEANDKVTGVAKYTDDFVEIGILHAKLVTSKMAHAKILSIDTSEAGQQPGVQAIITGNDIDVLCGSLIKDRPPLARGKVRYYGEPIAIVIANSEYEAESALTKVRVQYEPLPVVNSTADALKKDAPLVHEYNGFYSSKKIK